VVGGAVVEVDRDVVRDLDRLIDPVTRGDPESPLRWTSKSLGKLREALVGMGHEISERTLGKLLKREVVPSSGQPEDA
jgi:Rhodopirellula transposase DDE domain